MIVLGLSAYHGNVPAALVRDGVLVAGVEEERFRRQGQACCQQYGFHAIHLLPMNLYGRWDKFDRASPHVIPVLMRNCFEAVERAQGEIVCWGDRSPTREVPSVEDCAEAIVRDRDRDLEWPCDTRGR